MPGVATGYSATYFGDVDGYDAAQKAAGQNKTVAPDISGIHDARRQDAGLQAHQAGMHRC